MTKIGVIAALALTAICAGAVAASLVASIDPRGGPAATPPALGAFGASPEVRTPRAWEARRALLQRVFETEVFGRLPDAATTKVLSRAPITDHSLEDVGDAFSLEIEVTATFHGVRSPGRRLHIDLVIPRSATAAHPAPVVLIETFCPLMTGPPMPAATHGGPFVPCTHGLRSSLLRHAFGFQLSTPPLRDFLNAGIAVAAAYPSEIVPDEPAAGEAALDAMAGPIAGSDKRWGAIAAWGWIYSRMADAVVEEVRLDRTRIAVLGHSRYGKAALFAAAFDKRFRAVVSRASGAGGAALSRGKIGERIGVMTQTYPHWFAPRFRRYAGRENDLPIDQHLLLALIAPRRVFLGNGRFDNWSDPNGVWRAAVGADPVWKLLGARGLDQPALTAFNPQADLAYRLRDGPHWALDRDWRDILAFLTADFFVEAASVQN